MYFDDLCSSLSRLPEVEAIALGGSRAGECYDETSDYDLYVYCAPIPSEGARKALLGECCAYMELSNSFWELEDDCTLKRMASTSTSSTVTSARSRVSSHRWSTTASHATAIRPACGTTC